MTRTLAALIALLLATGAGAADAKTTKDISKPPKSKVTAEQAKAVRTGKAQFMAAVGSCNKPDLCDPKSPARNPELVTMLQRSEELFRVACVQCASDAACEQEIARIKDGRGRFGYNVCMNPEEKPAPAKGK